MQFVTSSRLTFVATCAVALTGCANITASTGIDEETQLCFALAAAETTRAETIALANILDAGIACFAKVRTRGSDQIVVPVEAGVAVAEEAIIVVPATDAPTE